MTIRGAGKLMHLMYSYRVLKGYLYVMDIRYITSLPVNDRMNFGLQAAGHIANGSLTMF